MDYVELNCRITPGFPASDIIMSVLSDMGYESFVENDEGFQAYIPAIFFREESLKNMPLPPLPGVKVELSHHLIREKNWNEVWERNYKAVKIGNWFIRAPFHEAAQEVFHEIIIAPKMAFGTGHHETTNMMIQLLSEMDLTGKTFLDLGCGTGVLTVMAGKKGAASLTAVDIDHWAYENTLENLALNEIRNAVVLEGNIQTVSNQKFDVIAANIHLNMLLTALSVLKKMLKHGALLMMSGFYDKDLVKLTTAARKYGLNMIQQKTKNKWMAITLINH